MTNYLLRGLIVASLCLQTPVIAQKSPKELLWPKDAGASKSSEIISMAMTYPIPMSGGLAGCSKPHQERYCRADGSPIRKFTIVEQRLSGTSTIDSMAIVDGCFVVKVTLSVAPSTEPQYSCEGGEAKFSLRAELSTENR
jgi:hypothetical protein